MALLVISYFELEGEKSVNQYSELLVFFHLVILLDNKVWLRLDLASILYILNFTHVLLTGLYLKKKGRDVNVDIDEW